MATLLEPGITYTEVPIQWDTWEDAMVAVCTEEDKKWAAEVHQLLYGNKPLFDANEVEMQQGYRFYPVRKNDGPFGFLLEEKMAYYADFEKEVAELQKDMDDYESGKLEAAYQQQLQDESLMKSYQPVKPIDYITVSSLCPELVEPLAEDMIALEIKFDFGFGAEEPKMRLVDSLMAMRK